jgi:hypothetical protein
MSAVVIVTMVITLMTGGQEYARNVPMESVAECLKQAATVLAEAARVEPDKADTPEIGAGCVIKLDPGQPA